MRRESPDLGSITEPTKYLFLIEKYKFSSLKEYNIFKNNNVLPGIYKLNSMPRCFEFQPM